MERQSHVEWKQQWCWDGKIQADHEECDNWTNNWKDGICSSTCKKLPLCSSNINDKIIYTGWVIPLDLSKYKLCDPWSWSSVKSEDQRGQWYWYGYVFRWKCSNAWNSASCQSKQAWCWDWELIKSKEECDLWSDNWKDWKTCTSSCKLCNKWEEIKGWVCTKVEEAGKCNTWTKVDLANTVPVNPAPPKKWSADVKIYDTLAAANNTEWSCIDSDDTLVKNKCQYKCKAWSVCKNWKCNGNNRYC